MEVGKRNAWLLAGVTASCSALLTLPSTSQPPLHPTDAPLLAFGGNNEGNFLRETCCDGVTAKLLHASLVPKPPRALSSVTLGYT